MIGFFDPPATKVRRHLPPALHAAFDSVRAQVETTVPEHLNASDKRLVEGYVMTAWALAKHFDREITLGLIEGSLITEVGKKCRAKLGSREEIAIRLTNLLVDRDVA